MEKVYGRFVLPDKTVKGTVTVSQNPANGENIIEETNFSSCVTQEGCDFVFDDDCLIFPGFIDIHVHAREDSEGTLSYKEDYISAGKAALRGGVTAFFDMPNHPDPPLCEASYKRKKTLLRKSLLPVILYGAAGPGTKPLPFDLPYKAFMGPSTESLYFKNDRDIKTVFKRYKGSTVSFHAESAAVLREHSHEKSHGKKRPEEAEYRAVSILLDLFSAYPLKQLNICHVTTKKACEMILSAKKQGMPVSMEITPHHLLFNESVYQTPQAPFFHVNPPLRSEENRRFLLEIVKNGDIDYLATDHAPHTYQEKKGGVSGFTGLDIYGNFAAWLIAKGISEQIVLNMTSRNPGIFFNRFAEKNSLKRGSIEEGFNGDLTVLCFKPHKINPAEFGTKHKFSVYKEIRFPGKVMKVFAKKSRLSI